MKKVGARARSPPRIRDKQGPHHAEAGEAMAMRCDGGRPRLRRHNELILGPTKMNYSLHIIGRIDVRVLLDRILCPVSLNAYLLVIGSFPYGIDTLFCDDIRFVSVEIFCTRDS